MFVIEEIKVTAITAFFDFICLKGSGYFAERLNEAKSCVDVDV